MDWLAGYLVVVAVCVMVVRPVLADDPRPVSRFATDWRLVGGLLAAAVIAWRV